MGCPMFLGEGEHTFISKDMDSWIDVEVLIKFVYFCETKSFENATNTKKFGTLNPSPPSPYGSCWYRRFQKQR